MNLRLRRLVRTPHSEQFTLYRLDEEDVVIVGKVDLHFTDEGVFGTLLMWDEDILSWDNDRLNQFVAGLVEDMCEPSGMPESYFVEFFAPSLDTFRFFSNEEFEEEAD